MLPVHACTLKIKVIPKVIGACISSVNKPRSSRCDDDEAAYLRCGLGRGSGDEDVLRVAYPAVLV